MHRTLDAQTEIILLSTIMDIHLLSGGQVGVCFPLRFILGSYTVSPQIRRFLHCMDHLFSRMTGLGAFLEFDNPAK